MAVLHWRQHQPGRDGANQLLKTEKCDRRIAENLYWGHEVPAGGGRESVRGQGQADEAGQGKAGGPLG